ncbi:MAG: cytochrome c [Anaerolineae bacterium]|nr:cytochrome c [Anaerolineae bacterium]
MNGRIWAALLIVLLALPGCFQLNVWLATAWAAPPAAADPVRGETIFRAGTADAPPCSTCHQVSTDGMGFSLGPNLAGVAARAGARVDGMSTAQYLADSILHPEHYVVAGYHVSMFADYAAYLAPQDVADLVAYLLTL